MDERLISALSSGRGSRVYGYRVFDLKLRHVLGLHLLESPYALGGMVTDADVVLAARLFSAQNEKEWWAALRGGSRLKMIWKGLRYGKLKTRVLEQEKLEQWLECEMLTPQVLDREGGRKLKIHWLVNLLSGVMRQCGCTMAEAWWVRFADIAWAKVSWDEQDGAEFVILDDKLVEELMAMGHTREDLGL